MVHLVFSYKFLYNNIWNFSGTEQNKDELSINSADVQKDRKQPVNKRPKAETA